MPIGPRGRLTAGALTLALLIAACGTGGGTPVPATSGNGTPTRSAPVAPSASGQPTGSASAGASGTPSTGGSAGPSDDAAGGAFDPAAVTVSVEQVLEIPGAPLAVTAAPDGSGRLFVTERGGRVWIVQDGQRSEQPFLDIATRITAGGEMGLLGFAFHPSWPEDPRFFIYYSNKDRDQVVAERRLDPADPNRADRDYERQLLVMDDFAANHNGGALVFGPDGQLYIATGDGGGAGDPEGTGQRLDTHLGKILRIGVDDTGDAPYAIPDGNPFAGREGALPEIWHLGLRNPWRFSFDRATGDLWIGDVGQNQYEEIDVARDGAAGRNFGWSVAEGRHCFPSGEACAPEGLTPPVTEYSHDLGCSVTGGVVYRGTQWPELTGAYLFSDYCTGKLWAIDATEDEIAEPTVVAETGRSISAFGEDEAGEVYLTDLSGSLLRLVAPAR